MNFRIESSAAMSAILAQYLKWFRLHVFDRFLGWGPWWNKIFKNEFSYVVVCGTSAISGQYPKMFASSRFRSFAGLEAVMDQQYLKMNSRIELLPWAGATMGQN